MWCPPAGRTPAPSYRRPTSVDGYPLTVTSDAEVVRRVRAGDQAAYAVLVARYRGRLGRYAVHMVGDPEDAEEALQDAFVRAYRSLHRCRDDGRFGAWLFGILVNRCRTAGRRAARRQKLFVRDEVTIARTPVAEATEPPDWGDSIRHALERLTAPLREAFLLKHVEDMDYEEMARVTGVRVSALKMRVLRAREQLRALLSEVERV